MEKLNKNSKQFNKSKRKHFKKIKSDLIKCYLQIVSFANQQKSKIRSVSPHNDAILSIGDKKSLFARKPRVVTKASGKELMHDGSFHQAIGPVLVVAQIFCLMPVRGILASSAKGLSFSWMSFRTWYCCFYIFGTIVDTIFTILMVFNGELDVRNMEPIIFHMNILLASLNFLKLAEKWPKLALKWEAVEKHMPVFRSWREREELARKVKMTTLVLLVLSLTEHLLSIISAVHFANYCPARKDPIESYLYTASNQIFFLFDYNHFLAFLGKLENVLLTFGWSYMDIFSMMIGIGLSFLFKRVYREMEKSIGKSLSEKQWALLRVQYRLICDLVEDIDNAVSGIIMISFANNLYFVCIQLLKSINKMPSTAHGIYFYFSLGFLMARTLTVSLLLSDVNDSSRLPMEIFKEVAPEAYNSEVKRFAYEVSKDVVALTGLKYFDVTRKLVLTVAGTIVTYELVLLQFHEDQKIWNCGE